MPISGWPGRVGNSGHRPRSTPGMPTSRSAVASTIVLRCVGVGQVDCQRPGSDAGALANAGGHLVEHVLATGNSTTLTPRWRVARRTRTRRRRKRRRRAPMGRTWSAKSSVTDPHRYRRHRTGVRCGARFANRRRCARRVVVEADGVHPGPPVEDQDQAVDVGARLAAVTVDVDHLVGHPVHGVPGRRGTASMNVGDVVDTVSR